MTVLSVVMPAAPATMPVVTAFIGVPPSHGSDDGIVLHAASPAACPANADGGIAPETRG